MHAWSIKRALRSVVGGLVASLILVSASVAQTSKAAVDAFLANPGQALSQFANGGPRLVAFIRNLALSSPATLPVIMSLLANATPAQQAAIGAGLGQAAQASLKSNPSYANQIQQAVAAANVPAVTASYSAATGNSQTASTGGGGGGGGGGVGGPTGNSPPSGGGGGGGGSTSGGGSSQTSNSGQTVSSGGTVGSSGSTSSGSVSPSR